ncbi:hypothetical protein [Paracidovorax oryzae]|nr:hypothetical protein [Paracidovorax oryzae]
MVPVLMLAAIFSQKAFLAAWRRPNWWKLASWVTTTGFWPVMAFSLPVALCKEAPRWPASGSN